MANSPLLSKVGDRCAENSYTILDGIMNLMHPNEFTVTLQHMLEGTPEFGDFGHGFFEGAADLAQYSKFTIG